MFSSVPKYIFVFLVGLLTAYLLTPLVMRLAVRIGMVDRPDERRIHKGVIPRGGGIAVFFAFHLACAAIYFIPWPGFTLRLTQEVWLAFLPASAFLLLVGMADDLRGLRPRVKLGGQIIAALVLYQNGFRLGGILVYTLPWYLDCALTVLWCLGFINAFNLIDGLDGLAAGLGIIAAAGMAGALLLYRIPGDAMVLIGLIGACLGFLRYNFAPARVFLGDSGSMFIGFTLAAISLWSGFRGTIVAAMAIPLLAAGVPILDTALAIWRRSMRQLNARNGGGAAEAGAGAGAGRVSQADTDHLHHRLLRMGLSHRRVAGLLYLFNAALVLVGLMAIAFDSVSLAIYMTAFVVAVYVVVRHLAYVELWHSGLALVNGLRRPPGRALAVIAYPALDMALLAVVWVIAVALTAPDDLRAESAVFAHLVPWLGIPFVFIAGSGAYRRIWSRARIMDYVTLAVGFAAGTLLTFGFQRCFDTPGNKTCLAMGLLYGSLGIIGLMGLRMAPRIARDMLSILLRRNTFDVEKTTRVPCLVYGVGSDGILCLRELGSGVGLGGRQRVVVGVLDDDANMHGRSVYGHRVLGGLSDLESAVTRHGAEEVIVTCDVTEPHRQALTDLVLRRKVRVLRWHSEIQPLFGDAGRPSAAGVFSPDTEPRPTTVDA